MAQVEHGSCFAGVLAELLWAVDRSYMMEDEFEGIIARSPQLRYRMIILALIQWVTD